MTVNFECDKHELDEYTSDLMETARVIIEQSRTYIYWSDDPKTQQEQYCAFKKQTSYCLKIISFCTAPDAAKVVDEVMAGSPEEYVPWHEYRMNFLHKREELKRAYDDLEKFNGVTDVSEFTGAPENG